MTETKIRRSIFILIGLTVLLLIGMVLGWFFVLVRPQKEAIAEVQGNYEKRKSVADGLQGALDAQQKADDKKRYVDAQLAFFRGNAETGWQGRYRAFRYGDIGDPNATMTKEQTARRNDAFGRALRENFSNYGISLGEALTEQANAVPLDHGRKLLFSTSVKVDAPPKMPEDLTIPANGLIKPTAGTGDGALACTVVGSFNQIKDYFNRINRAPILFVIGTVKLTVGAEAGATSSTTTAGALAGAVNAVSTLTSAGPPPITCTFNITPYLLATGEGAQKLTIGGAAPAADGDAGGVGGPGADPGAPNADVPPPAP